MNQKKSLPYFLIFGRVLLTNSCGHETRNKAIVHFKLDNEELNEWHHLTFDTDAFVFSLSVHMRKPDADIFKMAVDIS
jgi:hypothetical protein